MDANLYNFTKIVQYFQENIYMTIIRNIIFDFGGVIYDIDFQKSIIEFQKLGLEKFDLLYSKAIQDKLFEKLETDLISPSDFRDEIRKQFDNFVSDEQIELAWNALLVGFCPERLKLLDDLRSHYDIYLFSNTNRIHYPVFLKEFQDLTGFQSFNNLFRKAYFSFDMKCRKPDLDSYLYVLENAGLNASETLFIDDSQQNIQPAIDLGIHTYYLDLLKGEDVMDIFSGTRLKKGLTK